jgi:hypothetical protein
MKEAASILSRLDSVSRVMSTEMEVTPEIEPAPNLIEL